MSYWRKIKAKVNLIIDVIMLVSMMAVAGIGLLMKYILLPGYKVNEVYGRNVELYFWGFDRHQWGAIHLYVALFLLFLLILHILFHWDMIVCILTRMVSGRNARLVVFIIIGLLSLILALAPFVLKPEVRQMERPHNHSREVENVNQLPADSAGERLGRLKKNYAFDFNDLREFIIFKQNKAKD